MKFIMKRIMFMVAATALFSAPLLAQTQVKVDKEAILKKVEKSDADIANPKKNTKSAVWLDRGKVMAEAGTAASSGLYRGIDKTAMTLLFGKPKSTQKKKIGDVQYEVCVYPNFDAYMQEGKLAFWEPKLVIVEGALDKAYEAYAKAVEVDPKAADKAKVGMVALANVYKQDAENAFSHQDYQAAATAFKKAYDIQMNPAVNVQDTATIFNAGFLYTVAQDYQNGLDCLKETLEKYNYENDGDTYYYMFHCYYGLKDNEGARDILMKGLANYPKNNKIVEGLLGLYSSGGGDPKEIIPIVEKAVQDDPKNPELWGGLGRIYDKLNQPDKAIDAFAKAAELAPKDFGSQFNLGLLYIKKGDALNNELNQTNFTSQAEYNSSLDKVNAVYAKAIPVLERALELQPNEPSTVELLKNVCFRLRDEPGVMDKYNKYNEMFKNLPAQQQQ